MPRVHVVRTAAAAHEVHGNHAELQGGAALQEQHFVTGWNRQQVAQVAFRLLRDRGEFLAAIEALAAGGVRELAFYNWGHLRSANVAWIADAMKILDAHA